MVSQLSRSYSELAELELGRKLRACKPLETGADKAGLEVAQALLLNMVSNVTEYTNSNQNKYKSVSQQHMTQIHKTYVVVVGYIWIGS